MSTKLYNGVRLAEGVDPFDFLSTIKRELRPLRDRADASRLMRLYAASSDAYSLTDGSDQGPRTIRETAQWWIEVQKRLKRDSYLHDPERIEFSLGLDSATQRYLGYLYCEERATIERFLALPEVEEYAYWDNSDRPEGISAKEWKERGKAWARVARPSLSTGAYHWVVKVFDADTYFDDVFRQPSLLAATARTRRERAGDIAVTLFPSVGDVKNIPLLQEYESLERDVWQPGEGKQWSHLRDEARSQLADAIEPLLDDLSLDLDHVFPPSLLLHANRSDLQAKAYDLFAASAKKWQQERLRPGA